MLVRRYNRVVDEANQLAVTAPAHASVRAGELDEIRSEMEQLDGQAAKLRHDDEALKKRAIRDGVPASAFRWKRPGSGPADAVTPAPARSGT